MRRTRALGEKAVLRSVLIRGIPQSAVVTADARIECATPDWSDLLTKPWAGSVRGPLATLLKPRLRAVLRDALKTREECSLLLETAAAQRTSGTGTLLNLRITQLHFQHDSSSEFLIHRIYTGAGEYRVSSINNYLTAFSVLMEELAHEVNSCDSALHVSLRAIGRQLGVDELKAVHEFSRSLALAKTYSERAQKLTEAAAPTMTPGTANILNAPTTPNTATTLDTSAVLADAIHNLRNGSAVRNVHSSKSKTVEGAAQSSVTFQLSRMIQFLSATATKEAGESGTVSVSARRDPDGGFVFSVDDDGLPPSHPDCLALERVCMRVGIGKSDLGGAQTWIYVPQVHSS